MRRLDWLRGVLSASSALVVRQTAVTTTAGMEGTGLRAYFRAAAAANQQLQLQQQRQPQTRRATCSAEIRQTPLAPADEIAQLVAAGERTRAIGRLRRVLQAEQRADLGYTHTLRAIEKLSGLAGTPGIAGSAAYVSYRAIRQSHVRNLPDAILQPVLSMLFGARRYAEAAQLGVRQAASIGALSGRTVLAALARMQEQQTGRWTGARRAFDWEEFRGAHVCEVRRAARLVVGALDKGGKTDGGHVCALLAMDLAWARGARLPREPPAWWFSQFAARGLTPGPAAYGLLARAYERCGDRVWAQRVRGQQGAGGLGKEVDRIVQEIMAEQEGTARQRVVARAVARLADAGRLGDARRVWRAGDPQEMNYRALGRLALAACAEDPAGAVSMFAAACRAAQGGTRAPAFGSLLTGVLRAALDAPSPDARFLALDVCALAAQHGVAVNAEVFGMLLARLPTDDRGVGLALRLALRIAREGVVPDDMAVCCLVAVCVRAGDAGLAREMWQERVDGRPQKKVLRLVEHLRHRAQRLGVEQETLAAVLGQTEE
ncbi:hypothetical protein GGI15_003560 [Coemansia interrupta]|uniref:Uncharacterized protein n=1 Tax=Coemansia interrupta TaxID=1126814 RepID=A0A9W8LHL0_9FUNG|nr:hypothetical protein GGI15_003560 [Coemansia interrupta]